MAWIVLGPTGVGKSFIASALAQKACRDGHSALYLRAAALLRELALARADGSLHNFLARLLPNCRSRAGTSRSPIPPSPMASWAVWFTTPSASKCAASPCARNAIRYRTRKRNEPKPVSVRCLSYGTNFPEPTSGQLPEPAFGAGRCSTADESHAEPHAPITAGLAVNREQSRSLPASRLCEINPPAIRKDAHASQTGHPAYA